MNDVKVTRALSGNSLSGKITFVAKKGQHVQIDDTTTVDKPGVFNDDVAWKLADGTRGFMLERDVIVGPLPIGDVVFNTPNSIFGFPDVINPDTLVGYASARQVQEFEVEGDDLVDSSLDGSTAAGTEVTLLAGKVGLKGSGDEVYGHVRGQLAPLDPDNNDFRLLIEVAG
jgi:hypothetical protein